MPALDFTAWPSKPAAPPAGSPGAPRPTARTGAPQGPKAGQKTGSSGAADGGFGQLVDRLADAPDEGRASSPGVSARGSRDTGIGEESAAEPRAKKVDADGAGGTANDAPAAPATAASHSPAFPWTLPLNPSLWSIEGVQGDGESAGETEGEGDSVIGAATMAIADGAAGACFATVAGVSVEAETSAMVTVPVETPVAVHPDGASAAESAPSATVPDVEKTKEGRALEVVNSFPWIGATAGSASAAAGANVTETGAGGDPLADAGIAGAAGANAATAGEVYDGVGAGTGAGVANGQGAAALTADQIKNSSSVDPDDSALLAQSAMDAARMAAAVEGSGATTAAVRTGQADAAIDAALPADQAREQALIELQRALDAARANAASTASKQAGTADGAGTVVIQTGANAGADASRKAADAAIEQAAAHAGAGSSMTIDASGGEAGAGGGVDAAAMTSASSRARENRQVSEEASADGDSAITGASSWAAAAAAKYAEAAGAGGGASSGDPRDGGTNADAAAAAALAGRASGDAGGMAPIGFDARMMAASRTDGAAGAELPGGWAGEPVVTTAAPEEQAAQIVRSMRLQWRGTAGEATLRLQPDHLGQVFVSVRVEQGVVSATVRAETPAAQQWIQQHQQQLRDALDAQGLRVAQFHVTSNPDDRPRRDQEQDQNQDTAGRRHRPRARNTDATDRRFEIHL